MPRYVRSTVDSLLNFIPLLFPIAIILYRSPFGHKFIALVFLDKRGLPTLKGFLNSNRQFLRLARLINTHVLYNISIGLIKIYYFINSAPVSYASQNY